MEDMNGQKYKILNNVEINLQLITVEEDKYILDRSNQKVYTALLGKHTYNKYVLN